VEAWLLISTLYLCTSFPVVRVCHSECPFEQGLGLGLGVELGLGSRVSSQSVIKHSLADPCYGGPTPVSNMGPHLEVLLLMFVVIVSRISILLVFIFYSHH